MKRRLAADFAIPFAGSAEEPEVLLCGTETLTPKALARLANLTVLS